jgi:alpha-tubulin suppressor-like RCC1 family protein
VSAFLAVAAVAGVLFTTASPASATRLTGVVQVSAGSQHTCAVLEDRTVRCWGSNEFGQLGDGTHTNRRRAVAVPGLENVTQVAAGGTHTCARIGGGTVKCWGWASWGQLGDGTSGDPVNHERLTPVTVVGLSSVTQISAGDKATCARRSDSTVWCWGANDAGQLGDGTTKKYRLKPVKVSGITTARQVDLGPNHGCARLANSTAVCWGWNAQAQLGAALLWLYGGFISRTPVAVFGLTSASGIAAGIDRSCARKWTDGSIWCWGTGYIGDGVPSMDTPFTRRTKMEPARVKLLANTTGFDISGPACAALRDGTVRCWGIFLYGQLGDGTGKEALQPVAVKWLNGVRQLSTGATHTCAVRTDGTVRCWGGNYAGQLGDGTTTDRPTIVSVII